MYQLVVIWQTGEKETHVYKTCERAEYIAAGYERAFGNQIFYIYVQRV